MINTGMGRITRTVISSGRLAGLLLGLICWLGSMMEIARAEGDRPLAAGWTEALRPLQGMPVQDNGFIRSGYTFGDNQLKAIAGLSSYRGMGALETSLWLMADPGAASSEPLLKIQHPDLVRFFGGKRIPLTTFMHYLEPDNQEALGRLVQQKTGLNKPLNELDDRATHLQQLEHNFAIIPRPGEWATPTDMAGFAPEEQAIVAQWQALKAALRANDPQAGGMAARQLAAGVQAAAARRNIALPHLKLDLFYHRHQPFVWAAVFYLLAALSYGASLAYARRAFSRAGWGLLALGFTAQLLGIGLRWLIVGRAPLSNMFESFTFAIAGLVLVALVFETISHNRLGGLGGAILGFIFMILAYNAPIVFDSQIRPLMPALQSSWLTYHVVTIMLSYSAFALSFFVSLVYLTKDVLGGDQGRLTLLRRVPSLEAMDLFNYRIIGVGFPLLTLGIIFGAVWAATAWGRPWGFDPKETWSAITWLIYAIYLHARYLAGWKGRRAAVLALLGFGAVLFTYLGVNYLLSGLHSYAG